MTESKTSLDTGTESEGDVLFLQNAPPTVRKLAPTIELGGWKNATLESSAVTNDTADNSGNEDPNRTSFASIDHAEMVRLRFEAKQKEILVQKETEQDTWTAILI